MRGFSFAVMLGAIVAASFIVCLPAAEAGCPQVGGFAVVQNHAQVFAVSPYQQQQAFVQQQFVQRHARVQQLRVQNFHAQQFRVQQFNNHVIRAQQFGIRGFNRRGFGRRAAFGFGFRF